MPKPLIRKKTFVLNEDEFKGKVIDLLNRNMLSENDSCFGSHYQDTCGDGISDVCRICKAFTESLM